MKPSLRAARQLTASILWPDKATPKRLPPIARRLAPILQNVIKRHRGVNRMRILVQTCPTPLDADGRAERKRKRELVDTQENSMTTTSANTAQDGYASQEVWQDQMLLICVRG